MSPQSEPLALRRQMDTRVRGPSSFKPPPFPPRGVLELVQYAAPHGQNYAYMTPIVDGPRRPAIIWIAGGFNWDINSGFWAPAPRENDQSARAFREEGIVTFYPSLRGQNGNPGSNECMLGEVDDILAAREALAARPDVDPERIYLGGHSTGATLALLAAASSTRFRAVFALGPVADVREYGSEPCGSWAGRSDAEIALRSPVRWLHRIETPTFVIEGEFGNARSLETLRASSANPALHWHVIPGRNHFDTVAVTTERIALAILGSPDPMLELDDLRVIRPN